MLTQRDDNRFWIDNRDPATIPDRLRDLVSLWRYQSPWFFDEFDRLEEVFPAASYQYVLYGMGFRTEVDPADTVATRTLAGRLIAENAATAKRLRSQLPRHRDLITKIREHGLQAI
jgi:tryptophan halogenase